MDLNLPPPEELLEDSTTHYSVAGSIYPTRNSEGWGIQTEGNQGALKYMPRWLAQLVAGGNNNLHRALEQSQNMKPPVYEGEADPLQAEGWLL